MITYFDNFVNMKFLIKNNFFILNFILPIAFNSVIIYDKTNEVIKVIIHYYQTPNTIKMGL